MISVNVEVDEWEVLEEVSDQDLITEIKSRNINVAEHGLLTSDTKVTELVTQIYHLRRTERSYDHLMDELIYQTLGKIV